MLKVKINNEFFEIDINGNISTMDRKAINPQEWRAKSILTEENGQFKTLEIKDVTSAGAGKTYLRSEEHGLPKLLAIEDLEII